MSETEHTPLPWKRFGLRVFDAESGVTIAVCKTEEDAEFIVLIANSHDDLRDALEFLLTCYLRRCEELIGDKSVDPETFEEVQQARDALAKATPEGGV